MKTLVLLFTVFVLPQVLLAGHHGSRRRYSSTGDLVQDLKNAGLTTLLELVVKAGLAETLLSVEPATIFAPTNRAFAKLLATPGVAKALEDDPDLLKNTLLYHVIPNAAVKSSALQADQSVGTAAGAPVRVNVYKSWYPLVTVNGVKVIRADVMAGKGSVVHVVDSVLPTVGADDNIAAVLTKDGRFGTLLAAVGAAGLAEAVSTTDGLTVFAPTDDAFAKLPAGTVEALLGDIPTLTGILTRHVVPKPVFAAAISHNSFPTLNENERLGTKKFGGRHHMTVVKAFTSKGKARVVDADIVATNGVIHAIDSVI